MDKPGAEVQPTDWELYKIATEGECRFSIIEELEASVEANLNRAESLRQAILSQAFAGKLVGAGAEMLPKIFPSLQNHSLPMESFGDNHESRACGGQ